MTVSGVLCISENSIKYWENSGECTMQGFEAQEIEGGGRAGGF